MVLHYTITFFFLAQEAFTADSALLHTSSPCSPRLPPYTLSITSHNTVAIWIQLLWQKVSNLLFNTWWINYVFHVLLIWKASVSTDCLVPWAWCAPKCSRKSPNWISYNIVTLTTHTATIFQHVAKYFISSCWKMSVPLSTCLPHPILKYKCAWSLDHHMPWVTLGNKKNLIQEAASECIPWGYVVITLPYLIQFINLYDNSSEWNFPPAG